MREMIQLTIEVVRTLAALLLASVALFGVFFTGVEAFEEARVIDANDRCRLGETGRCFSRVRGVVREGDSDLTVVYDDGRRTEELNMRDAAPKAGTRVWLETWDGYPVAVYDSSTETRYRTRVWPVRDWLFISSTLMCAAAAFALWPGLARSTLNLVRRRAASAPR